MKNSTPKILPPRTGEDTPAHPGNPKATPRKQLEEQSRGLRGSGQETDGLVQIEAISGLDFIPNRISSTPPTLIQLRPEDCYVDRKYQRNLSRRSMKLIYDIITAWDWAKFKPPVVTRDHENRYLVIDGQHTLIGAATHPGIKTVPCMFIPLGSLEEQAESFIGHNTARIPVTTLDLYHSRITSGDPTHVTVSKILNEHGIQVVRSTQARNNVWQSNQTVSAGQVIRILEKHGQAKFISIVDFVSKCGFSPIKADHWRFAEALLAGPERQNLYSPELMVQVVKAANQIDALNEASRIASSMEVAIYQALLVYYKNRYQETWKTR